MRSLTALLFIFCAQLVRAQEVEILSHYPGTAFVINRLIPFTLLPLNEVKISEVTLSGLNSCSRVIDPHYSGVFHIFCRQTGKLSIEVHFDRGGQKQKTQFNIEIFSEKAPQSVGAK